MKGLKKYFTFSNVVLLFLGLGVWLLVLQNLGVITVSQKVRLDGGYVSVVNGEVKVKGKVEVDNTVDINIQEINGQQDVFFNNPDRGQKDKYYRLPVTPY